MTREEADANSKILLTIAIIVAAFIGISYLGGGINSFLESLGLKSDPEEKKLDENIKKAEENAEKKQPLQVDWKPQDFNPYQYTLSLTNLQKYIEKNSTRLKINSYPSKYFKGNAAIVFNAIGKNRNPNFPNLSPDKPEEIYAAIKFFTTKLGIAYLSADYQKIYNKDLWSDLSSEMDTDEQKKILDKIYSYIDNLPVGVRDKKNNSIIM